MSTFEKTMNEHGWFRVEDKKDRLHIGPVGSTWRKGPVRIEAAGAEIGVHNFRVNYYDAFRNVWALSAIVVDRGERERGRGHEAMVDLIKIARKLKCEKIALECAPIHHSHTGDKRMSEKEKESAKNRLISWYFKLGFRKRNEEMRPIIMDLKLNEGE